MSTSEHVTGMPQATCAIALTMLLAACGGGGGGGDSGSTSATSSSTNAASGGSSASGGGTGSFSTFDAQRLIDQATFGPTPALVTQVAAQGLSWIDAQIATPASGYAVILPSSNVCASPVTSQCNRDNFAPFPIQLQFYQNALTGTDQLRQRAALAYSQIFVTSAYDQTYPTYAHRNYQQMLLDDAFANFRKILGDITLSPVMGHYLNMANNNKGNLAAGITPNENYAREVLQLFSIGPNTLNPDGTLVTQNGVPVPTYTQDTIEGFASAFTGWTYPNAQGATSVATNNYTAYYAGPMIPVTNQHDSGTKLLLNGTTLPAGQSAQVDLNAALDNIFNHPNVGPFIGKQMIQFLVTSNPSPAYVARVSAVFNNDGTGTRGNMGAVIKAILTDSEARGDSAPNATFGKLREPAVDVVAVLRALNGTTDGQYPNTVATQMGQPVFSAHTVFSFYQPSQPLSGSSGLVAPQFGLLNTSSSLSRLNFIYQTTFATNGQVATPDSTLTTTSPIGTQIDLSPGLPLASNVAGLITYLNNGLVHGTLRANEVTALTTAVNAIPSSDATLALDRVRAAVYLVMASPRYQITR